MSESPNHERLPPTIAFSSPSAERMKTAIAVIAADDASEGK